jgi:excisionase family DNA binding protein
MTKRKFTVEDAAEIAGLTTATIIKKIHKKQLKARRVRTYAIDGEEVKRFLLELAWQKKETAE